MAKKKENTDNKEVLGENKENSAAKTADAGAENGVASAQEKFQIKLRELLAAGKKEEKHAGVSGDQRLLFRHAAGCRAV